MDEQPRPTTDERYLRFSRAPARNRRFLLGLALILLAAALWIAWPYRAAIVLALVLGFALRPAYLRILPALRWRWLAALVMLLLVATAIVAPLGFIAWSLIGEAASVREAIADDGYRTRLVSFLQDMGLPADTARNLIQDGISSGATFLQGMLVTALASALDVILGLVVFFILLFYVLVDGDRMVEGLRQLIPLAERRRDMLMTQVAQRTRAILLGTFLVYALQGIVGGIGWWIFGFPAPIFWGFVMTIMAVLPFMGPQLVTIPAAIIAIAQGDTFGGIGLLVWTFVAVSLIDDVVRPYVIGRQSGVHPALILVGTLGGLKVLGLSGLILGPLLLGLLEPVLRTWARASEPPPEPAAPAGSGGSSGGGSGGRPTRGGRRLPPAS